MRMAMKDGQLIIIEVEPDKFQIIKSWNLMKWSRRQLNFTGDASLELLNRLAGIVRLPPRIEAERIRMKQVLDAVNRERTKKNPEPVTEYPVKMKLFEHQVRGANMALITFGIVDPPEEAK